MTYPCPCPYTGLGDRVNNRGPCWLIVYTLLYSAYILYTMRYIPWVVYEPMAGSISYWCRCAIICNMLFQVSIHPGWHVRYHAITISWYIIILRPYEVGGEYRNIGRISIYYFICILFVAMGNSLHICSDVTLKMAAWQPYWNFRNPDSNFSLALNITFKLH